MNGIRSRYITILSNDTKKRIIYSLRTTWSITICLILSYYLPWTKVISYFSPIISIISSVMYFGLWQSNYYKVIYGSFLGCSIGVLVGYTYQIKYLQVLLIFITIVWINRINTWDRLTIVFCSLSFILTALLPTITNGEVYGTISFTSIFAMINIPFLITGFSLLFPIPSLAIDTAKMKVVSISNKLVLMIRSVIRGFCLYNYHDLYYTEYDELLSEIEQDIDELQQLISYIEFEIILFYHIANIVPSLNMFVKIIKKMIIELNGIRDIAMHIKNNTTHQQFIDYMNNPLVEIDIEIEKFFSLLILYFNTYIPISLTCYPPLNIPIEPNSSIDMNRIYSIANNNEMMQVFKRSKHIVLPRLPRLPSNSITTTMHALPTVFTHYRVYESDVEEQIMYELDLTSTIDDSNNIDLVDSNDHTTCNNHHVTHRLIYKSRFIQLSHLLLNTRIQLLDAYQQGRFYVLQYFIRNQNTYQNNHINTTSNSNNNNSNNDNSNNNNDSNAVTLNESDNIRTKRSFTADIIDSLGCNNTNNNNNIIIINNNNNNINNNNYINTNNNNIHSETKYESSYNIDNRSNNHLQSHYHKSNNNPTTTTTNNKNNNNNNNNSNSNNIDTINIEINNDANIYGQRNFGPRASYVHKLSVVVELIVSLKLIFEPLHPSKGYWFLSYLKRTCLYIADYVRSYSLDLKAISIFLCYCLDPLIACNERIKHIKHNLYECIYLNANAIKISLAVVLSAALLIYQQFSVFYSKGYSNRIWIVIVIVLIRQDNTSALFLMGYQRLEGTVIGAIYSFIVYQTLNCSQQPAQSYCNPIIVYPAIVIWVFICCLYREGPYHGYAAIVAAFTPLVLLDTNSGAVGLTGTWYRIEETFIGVLIYLAIDNFIMPYRMYPILKSAVLDSIQVTGHLFVDVLITLKLLITLSNEDTIPHTSNVEKVTENDVASISTIKGIENYLHIFEQSKKHLEQIDIHIESFLHYITTQEKALQLVLHEPELFHFHTVPYHSYHKLLIKFKKVFRSGQIVISGIKAFSLILYQMIVHQEDISQHILLFSFMSKLLFDISTEAEEALQLAYDSLDCVYNNKEFNSDLSAIVLLRQSSGIMINKCNEVFLNHYLLLSSNTLDAINPYFNLAWQNVFETVVLMIYDLAELGMELHCIRNIELLPYYNS